MDIEKILQLAKNCQKLLNCVLAGEKFKISYAFEYILILIGENIHSIMEEIKLSLLVDINLFTKILKKMKVEFDENVLKENKEYCEEKFMAAFKKSNIGQNLYLLNFIRNELKHQFFHLNEQHHDNFRALYINVKPITKFVNDFVLFTNSNKDTQIQLTKEYFTTENIEKLDSQEIKIVKQILNQVKKIKTKTKTIEQQKNIILNRINIINQLMDKLDGYNIKLKESRGFKGHEIDLYAPLMCITVIGENCINLTAYRKKESKINDEIKKILKEEEYNKLFRTFSFLATKYTHQIEELPNMRQAQRTCESALAERNKFNELSQKIVTFKVTVEEEEEADKPILEEVPEVEFAPVRKRFRSEKEKVKIPSAATSNRYTLWGTKSDEPKLLPHSDKISTLPRNEIDEIFEAGIKKKQAREKSEKQVVEKSNKGESDRSKRKRT